MFLAAARRVLFCPAPSHPPLSEAEFQNAVVYIFFKISAGRTHFRHLTVFCNTDATSLRFKRESSAATDKTTFPSHNVATLPPRIIRFARRNNQPPTFSLVSSPAVSQPTSHRHHPKLPHQYLPFHDPDALRIRLCSLHRTALQTHPPPSRRPSQSHYSITDLYGRCDLSLSHKPDSSVLMCGLCDHAFHPACVAPSLQNVLCEKDGRGGATDWGCAGCVRLARYCALVRETELVVLRKVVKEIQEC